MCYRIKKLKKNILWSDNYGNRDHNRNLGKAYLGQGPGPQGTTQYCQKSDYCYTQNGQRVTGAQNCSWTSQWEALLTVSG